MEIGKKLSDFLVVIKEAIKKECSQGNEIPEKVAKLQEEVKALIAQANNIIGI